MTLGDGFIILLCLVAGYWFVSRMLGGPDPPPSGESAKSAETNMSKDPPGYEPVTQSNWYLVLEVSENATRNEIAIAYRRKISQYHPDKVSQMGEDIRAIADAKSQQINAAYEMGMRHVNNR